MNVAFLFNSDDPKYSGNYGWPICDTILLSEIPQKSNRHMKISLGDVLIHAKTSEEYTDLSEKTYFWHPWNHLFANKLRSTYMKATVYAWVFQNITEALLSTCTNS